jgi:pyruvate,water dikinase
VSGVVDSDRYRVFKAFLDDQSSTPIVERSLGRKRLKIINNDGVGGHDDQAGPTATVDTTEDERNRLVLDDPDLLALARWAVIIEDHYGRPMDIEWAKDGVTGDLFIVQARPETVEARRSGATLTTYDVSGHGPVLLKGLSVGAGAATGVVCRLDSPDEGDRFSDGAILVADTTDPDWVPVMQRAAAVVTNRGGRTSHAAIVSRELGVPAVVGAVDATTTLVEGQRVTVSCAGGDVGIVFDGSATIDTRELSLDDVPRTRTKVMVNLANPQAALKWWRLPTAGIGLARMEFIIGEHIGAHPMALAHPDRITDPEVRQAIEELADAAGVFGAVVRTARRRTHGVPLVAHPRGG